MASQDIEDIIYLIKTSDYHNWWGKEYFINYIKIPFSLRQYAVIRKDNRPICFATWGFPSADHIKEYLLDYKFPVEGFSANGEDVWIIDFISVGGMRNTAIGFRKLKSMLSKEGYSQAFWFRTETSKLGFHDWS
tara:strand:+ start:321 stop:722 length:402 start_codon:yes stop_codon:yes gene_type:complete